MGIISKVVRKVALANEVLSCVSDHRFPMFLFIVDVKMHIICCKQEMTQITMFRMHYAQFPH